MLALSPETEALVQAKAAITGKTPDQLIREAMARHVPARELPKHVRQPIDLAKVEDILASVAARPVLDPRGADDFIGYDAFGVPR